MGALYILDTSVVIGVVTNNVCGERKLNNFQISSNKLMDFGAKIESLYDANGNAYHNSIHAADVCQSLNYIFRQNCVMNRGFK